MNRPNFLESAFNNSQLGFCLEIVNNAFIQSSWLDFGINIIQTTAAASIALSLLGPGALTAALCYTFVATPICTKAIVLLTDEKGLLENATVKRAAMISNQVVRTAARIICLVASLKVFSKYLNYEGFEENLGLVAVSIFLFSNKLLHSCLNTLCFAKSKAEDYYSFDLHFNQPLKAKFNYVWNNYFSAPQRSAS